MSASTTSGAVVALDLDGVIWRGTDPIAPAIEGAARLRAAGLQVVFLSNNSSVPVSGVVDKLRGMSVEAQPEEVITSALAAAHLLRRDLAAGAKVLVCGGPGVYEALVAEGLTAVDEGPADAVVVGLNRNFSYDGKPAHPIADLVRERFGPAGVMVGDRPSTDGAMADTLGWPFALVLSGVTAAVAPPGGEAIPDPPPPFVAADLGALVDPLVASLLHS